MTQPGQTGFQLHCLFKPDGTLYSESLPPTPHLKARSTKQPSTSYLKARSTKQAIIMAVIISTGGTAAVGIGAVTQQAAAITGAVVSEAALATAVACEAAGAAVAAETALATAIAAEAGVTALTGTTLANFWNPVGWFIGGILVGASQRTSQAVTWGCYKPIIGEVDTKETSIKPITFADLAAHPKVRRVFVCASAASANLPDVEVENRAGQYYLLRGVVLPWGSAAYHAERIDESIYTTAS